MKIAVTNENGQVFQHFGRTASFRVYDVEDQKVVKIDKENNLLIIRGAVPGPIGGLVTIRPTNKLPAPKANKWRLA